jgi:hypothetical protein
MIKNRNSLSTNDKEPEFSKYEKQLQNLNYETTSEQINLDII